MTCHLRLAHRNLALAGLHLLPLAACAVTLNPIDPALPLHLHASASCLQTGNPPLLVSHAGGKAACAGLVSVEDPVTLTFVNGNSTATADLASGTMKAKAVGHSIAEGSLAMRAGAFAVASLYDTLTVEGTWTGIRVVELKLDVDGSLLSNALQPNWQLSRIQSSLQIFRGGNAPTSFGTLGITQGNSGTPFISDLTEDHVTITSNANGHIFDPADVRYSFAYSFAATPSDRSFTFHSRLLLQSSMGFGTDLVGTPAEAVIDFGNSARFSLVLPADVSVSSASGQFLVPVPEPAAWGLFAVGLAVMGWSRRRGGF